MNLTIRVKTLLQYHCNICQKPYAFSLQKVIKLSDSGNY